MVWWLWAGEYSPSDGASSAPQSVGRGDVAFAECVTQHSLQAWCNWSEADGFYQFSDNWQKVTMLNPAACFEQGMLGQFSASSIKEWAAAIQDLTSANPAERLDKARLQMECVSNGTEACWLEMILVPVNKGGRLCLSVLVSNISAQKQMESMAERAIRESQIAQHGRASFLSNMSHELRTPLNAILGFAQLMEYCEAATPQQMREYLSHIRESGEDLLFKINDLLEVANVDAQTCRMQEGPQNIGDLIDAAIEMHSHAAYQRDVRICQPCSPRPAMIVQVDRAHLIHVFSNLLSDAVRRAERGGIIQFDWRTTDKGDLTISISDDGSGFSHKHLGNIKTALRSKRSYYLTDIDHIGVGMSVAKELVSLHGGAVQIEHCQEQGTQVSVTLPAARVMSQSARIKPKRRMVA